MAEATPQMPAYLQKQAEQYGLLIWGHGAGWRGMLKQEEAKDGGNTCKH